MRYLMIVKADENHQIGHAQRAALMAAVSEMAG
jgi:hypothetical protein